TWGAALRSLCPEVECPNRAPDPSRAERPAHALHAALEPLELATLETERDVAERGAPRPGIARRARVELDQDAVEGLEPLGRAPGVERQVTVREHPREPHPGCQAAAHREVQGLAEERALARAEIARAGL